MHFFPAHLNERKSAIQKSCSFSPESKRPWEQLHGCQFNYKKKKQEQEITYISSFELPSDCYSEPTPHAPAHIPTEAVYHQVGAELSARLICRLSETDFSHLWLRKMPACTNTRTAFCFPTIIWANPDSDIISAHFSLHKLLSNNVFFNSARCRSSEHKMFHTQNKHSEKHAGSR